MRESLNNLLSIGVSLLVVVGSAVAQKPAVEITPVRSAPTPQTIQPTQSSVIDSPVITQPSRMDRPLRVLVTVDSPTFLQVKEGQEIRSGDTITDNKLERERLEREKKSIGLHIENLKSRSIHKPFDPKAPIPSKPLPPAIFSEELAAISMAQMRLTQAKSVLEARTKHLLSENPEKRSEVEKAKTALQNASEKVHEQEELIKSMKDMKLQDQILQHEFVKLKQLTNDQEQLSSEVERAEAKLDASVTEQEQQLQQLQLAVRIAQSELEVAKSRLTASMSRRKIVEYEASIEATKRSQAENQTHLEYSRQQQQYEQAVRERDYQLAQMQISLGAIDEKLSQIPVVRSPRNGYIRRIKPWTGNNGKYSTTVVISLTPGSAKSPSSSRQGEKAATSSSDSTE